MLFLYSKNIASLQVLIEYVVKSTGDIGMLEDAKHNLEDGDFVQFSEIKGMTGLNTHAPMKVSVKSPSVINVGVETLAAIAGEYQGGGRLHQVKMPKTVSFKSLSASIGEVRRISKQVYIVNFVNFSARVCTIRLRQNGATFAVAHAVDCVARLRQ